VGQRGHGNNRGLHFYLWKGTKTVSWERDFLQTTEQGQQLGEENLLVTGIHI